MKKLCVLGFAALLLVAFAVPAMAEVKVGGIIFTDFYYLSEDKHTSGAGHSVGRTAIQVPNITRLYARWTNEDNVGMYIEFGIGETTGSVLDSNDDGVGLRHAYGWWDITPMFQLMAGKSTTPFSPLTPNQLLGTRSGHLNIIGVGYGEFYSGRFAQVRGTFHFNKNVRLAIALVDPHGKMPGQASLAPYGTADTKIPRIDVGLPIYVGNFKIYPGLMWQQRKLDDYSTAYSDDSITTWAGSLGVSAAFGPLSIQAEGNYGQNWGNTRGLVGVSPAAIHSAATLVGTKIDDTKTLAWWVDVGFKFGVATPHLMYGYMGSSGDKNPMDYESQMYGLSVPIDVAKGFRIRPEVMWYSNGNNNKDSAGVKSNNGGYSIYGVQFQITF
jgi:hypothetical protein